MKCKVDKRNGMLNRVQHDRALKLGLKNARILWNLAFIILFL